MEDEFPPDAVRSPEEVARRALALFSVVGVALGAPRGDVLQWLNETGIVEDLAPSEERFLGTPNPSHQQIVDGGWLSERLVVLCWALGKVEDLPPPDQQCDTALFQDLLPPFADTSTSSFIANATLQSDEVLTGKADELLHQHWEARNAKLTGARPKTPVDIEIVQERHHAINWVIGYDGVPWDEVTTDT